MRSLYPLLIIVYLYVHILTLNFTLLDICTFCAGFLKHFKDSFLGGLISKQLASKLFDKDLIPQSLKKEILEAKDNYEANSLLWQHAEVHYEFEDCICLCDIVRMEKGYPKMTRLGERMREELLQR